VKRGGRFEKLRNGEINIDIDFNRNKGVIPAKAGIQKSGRFRVKPGKINFIGWFPGNI